MQVIGTLNPYTRNAIESLESELQLELPVDYVAFLQCYGDGDINEHLYFHMPDPHFIKQNFEDNLDLWTLTDVLIDAICNSVTVGKSVDGDLFCYSGRCRHWMILPRHSEDVITKKSFIGIVSHYKEKGILKKNKLWFDPAYQRVLKSFNLIYDSKIEKSLIGRIENDFKDNYSFDDILNSETQPKYILQAIGGWIYFDNIYKSSIRLKFQHQFESKVFTYENFLQKHISYKWE